MLNTIYSAILFLALFSISSTVFACSGTAFSVEEQYKRASAIFEGEVIGLKSTETISLVKVKLRVDKVYKGLPGTEIELLAGSGMSSCDRSFSEGQKLVVFTGGDYPNEQHLYWSPHMYKLPYNQKGNIQLQMLEDKIRQLASIDATIAEHPESRDVLLRTKAEHLLFLHDDQQAEFALRDLIQHNKSDEWATDELMGVLYRLQKIQEILALENISQGEQGKLAISLATLVSGREAPPNFKIKIEDIKLKNLDRQNLKLRSPEFKNVLLSDSNFSGSEFLLAKVTDSFFVGDNFSKMLFGRAEILNSYFHAVNLGGADLVGASILNSKFSHVNMKDALLSGVKLDGSSYDCKTVWPDGFDPKAAGAKLMSECR